MNIFELLLEDVEQKKVYDCNHPTTCDLCYNVIEEEENLYFFGNKRKICQKCYEEISEELALAIT